MEGGAPMVRPGSNGGDANGDYAFVKYNKKIVRAWPTQLEFVLAAHSPPLRRRCWTTTTLSGTS